MDVGEGSGWWYACGTTETDPDGASYTEPGPNPHLSHLEGQVRALTHDITSSQPSRSWAIDVLDSFVRAVNAGHDLSVQSRFLAIDAIDLLRQEVN